MLTRSRITLATLASMLAAGNAFGWDQTVDIRSFTDLNGKTIAVLDNAKPGATQILDSVCNALSASAKGVRFIHARKNRRISHADK